jgi:hypothetical protein
MYLDQGKERTGYFNITEERCHDLLLYAFTEDQFDVSRPLPCLLLLFCR